MSRFSSLRVAGLFVISLALVSVARADDSLTDNPAYLSWAKFKPGTLVKYTNDTNAAGNATSIEITQTLKAVAPDQVTVEVKMTTVTAGNKTDMPPFTHQIAAKIKKGDANNPQTADAPKTESGTEDVTAAGKTFSCKTTTITSDANGMTTKATTWTCDDVPGNVVKMESQSTGAMSMSTKMILTDFEPQ
jgi:hypothetical protein